MLESKWTVSMESEMRPEPYSVEIATVTLLSGSESRTRVNDLGYASGGM